MSIPRALLLLAACGTAVAEVLKVGGIYNSGIGLRGKAAFDLWATWASSSSNTKGFTASITWVEYTDDAALTASVEQFVRDGVHAIIPPYTSGLTKKTVDAVPSGSTIPILAWGGASDSIFTTNCVGRKCFGGFTVASKYLNPSLTAVQAAAGGAITASIITNSNGFSASVTQGAKMFIDSTNDISLAKEVTLDAYKSNLTEGDIAKIATVIDAAPDVAVVVGHPGDVEDAVTRVRSDGKYKPKAVIAVNAFSTPSNYDDATMMDGVIMPEQWDENNQADSIVGWTPAAFREALGSEASYHSASAGGLAVAMTHAIVAGDDATRMDTIAEKMAALQPTQTFYGELSWDSQGMLRKPMYGKQKQGSDYVIVAPTGSIDYPLHETTSISGANRAATLAVIAFVVGPLFGQQAL